MTDSTTKFELLYKSFCRLSGRSICACFFFFAVKIVGLLCTFLPLMENLVMLLDSGILIINWHRAPLLILIDYEGLVFYFQHLLGTCGASHRHAVRRAPDGFSSIAWKRGRRSSVHENLFACDRPRLSSGSSVILLLVLFWCFWQ